MLLNFKNDPGYFSISKNILIMIWFTSTLNCNLAAFLDRTAALSTNKHQGLRDNKPIGQSCLCLRCPKLMKEILVKLII